MHSPSESRDFEAGRVGAVASRGFAGFTVRSFSLRLIQGCAVRAGFHRPNPCLDVRVPGCSRGAHWTGMTPASRHGGKTRGYVGETADVRQVYR